MKSMNAVFLLLSLTFSISLHAQTIDQALHAWEGGQPAKAKAMLSQIAKASPADARAQYHAGMIYLEFNRMDSALWFFNRGIQASDNLPHNYIGKGRIFLDQGNTEEARTYFNSAQSKQKKSPEVAMLIGKAWAESKNGNAEEARKMYDRALELDRNYAPVHVALGDWHLAKNNGGDAILSYERATELKPDYALAYYKIARVYVLSKNLANAETELLKLLAVNQDFPVAYRELGEVYFSMERYGDARDNYARYLEMAGSDLEAEKRLASILFVAGDFTQSLELAQRVLQKEPGNFVAKRIIAFNQHELGNDDAALSTITDYFETTHDSNYVALDYEYLGRIYSSLKMDSLALIALNQALEVDSSKVELYDLMVAAYANQKNYLAAADLMDVKFSHPAYEPTLDDYLKQGKYYYAASAYAQADTAFINLLGNASKATDTLRAQITGHYWRALANSAMDESGELGLAMPHFEQVITFGLKAADPMSFSKELSQAYAYLGYYYLVNDQCKASVEAWKKVLEYDAANVQAKDALTALNDCKG
jgi:tetratricopeptide (TPR) repeat protein